MADTSAFPPKLVAILTLISVGYFLVALAPVLFASLAAYRRRPTFPRPVLFVWVVASLVYGVLCTLCAVVEIPLSAYLIYVAPQLQASGAYTAGPLSSFSAFVASYWWVGLVPVQLVASILVTRYLVERWARVVAAIGA